MDAAVKLLEAISEERDRPKLETVKSWTKKYYRQHMQDVLRQLKDDARKNNYKWMNQINLNKLVNIENQIDKNLDVSDGDPTGKATNGFVYYYSTKSWMDDLKEFKLKNGLIYYEATLGVSIYVKKGAPVSLSVTTALAFENIPTEDGLDDDYFRPEYKTEFDIGGKAR